MNIVTAFCHSLLMKVSRVYKTVNLVGECNQRQRKLFNYLMVTLNAMPPTLRIQEIESAFSVVFCNNRCIL